MKILSRSLLLQFFIRSGLCGLRQIGKISYQQKTLFSEAKMIEKGVHSNEGESEYFPELKDIEYKRIVALSISLDKTYRNSNMSREDIISETYIAIKSNKRKFYGTTEYFDFIKNTMRSIARNSFDKMINKSSSLEDENHDNITSNCDTPEERFIKECEIKEVLNSVANHPELIELAKTIFVEGLTSNREISEKLGISFDRAKYLKKKMMNVAKNNISSIRKMQNNL